MPPPIRMLQLGSELDMSAPMSAELKKHATKNEFWGDTTVFKPVRLGKPEEWDGKSFTHANFAIELDVELNLYKAQNPKENGAVRFLKDTITSRDLFSQAKKGLQDKIDKYISRNQLPADWRNAESEVPKVLGYLGQQWGAP